MATCPAPSPPLSLAETVNPTDRQLEFLSAIANFDFVLYGGEAGGGKSYILRWWLVLFLFDCFDVLGLRNVRVGLFCEDYPTLEDRQISKIRYEFPEWLGSLARRDGALNFVLRDQWGGGAICLRNLDDPKKYVSAEFAAIAVEELTLNPLSVFNDLRFRLRWPGITRPKFAAGTNPGGVGHDWVKNYWVKKKYPPELMPKADQFVLVKAKASDNPHLPPNYHQDLLTLPPEMANRVARGDWDVFTGQYFPHFEYESVEVKQPDGSTIIQSPRHVISQAEALRRIKPWHTRFLSGDWGYDHPFAIYKHAKDERDRIITYGEIWGRLIDEHTVGRMIGELTAPERAAGIKFQSFPFSWDAGKASPRQKGKIRKAISTLVSEGMPKELVKPHPADSSPGSRIARARLTSNLLSADMLAISEACPKLIGCMPTLIKNEDNTEDVLKVDWSVNEIGDDPYDGASMGWQNELGAKVITPATVVADRKVAEYAEQHGKEVEDLDINTQAQLHRRALHAERTKRKKRRGGLGAIWRGGKR